MRAISLRNVPDQVYAVLQDMARANRRSLQEQVKIILEQEVKLVQGTTTSRAEAWRNKLKDREFNDIPGLVREDRRR
jgi:plasmid stability protein